MAVLWGQQWQIDLQYEIMGSINSKAYKREMAILWVNLQRDGNLDSARTLQGDFC